MILLAALLFAAADTGGVPVSRPVSVYIQLDINAHSTAQRPRDRWLGEDKLKHFAFSYLITSATAGSARLVADRNTSVVTGAALGLVAGIIKEIHDKRANRSASYKDILWDAAGIAAGVLVAQQAR